MSIETYKDFIEFSSLIKDEDTSVLTDNERQRLLQLVIGNYLLNGYVSESGELFAPDFRIVMENVDQGKKVELFIDESGRYFKNGNRFIAKNLRVYNESVS